MGKGHDGIGEIRSWWHFDPFASGLLPLLSGKAMRLTGKILTHDKSYLALFKFGKELERNEIEEKMAMLTGKVYNVLF